MTDNLCHARIASELHFIRVFPYGLRIASFPSHAEEICVAKLPTNDV